MNRLESIEPDLWKKLTASSSDSRRAAVLHACEFALRKTALENEAVLDAFGRLVLQDVFSPEETRDLHFISEELDDKHFEFEASDPEKSVMYFNQARAVAAVAFATRDTDESAADALYEAIQSNEDVDEILHHIHQAFDKLQTFLS